MTVWHVKRPGKLEIFNGVPLLNSFLHYLSLYQKLQATDETYIFY